MIIVILKMERKITMIMIVCLMIFYNDGYDTTIMIMRELHVSSSDSTVNSHIKLDSNLDYVRAAMAAV